MDYPGNLFAVAAPSGTGKSSLVKALLELDSHLVLSISHTTRKPRGQEQQGREYHFVDEPEFRRMISAGDFVEWAEVHGNLYGTARAEIEAARAEGKDVLLDLDVQGAAQVRERIKDAVTVFILPPSYQALEQRLRGRGQDDEATIERRLAAAASEIGLYKDYQYALVNDDVDACVEGVKSIIRAARSRVSAVAERARAICRTFETREETKTA